MRIYLDCCCVNRPFDDLSQVRVRHEAAAVAEILTLVETTAFRLLSSEVLVLESMASPNPLARASAIRLLRSHAEFLPPNSVADMRALSLMKAESMSAEDAAHVAYAETGLADCFLTVDDRLLRKCRRLGSSLPGRFRSRHASLRVGLEARSCP